MKNDSRKVIDTLTLAMLAMFVFLGYEWLLAAAFLLLLGNIFDSRITSAIACYWIKFSLLIAGINAKIILTALFYLVLTPMAFGYRLFNKELTDHFYGKEKSSNFENKFSTYKKEDFTRQW